MKNLFELLEYGANKSPEKIAIIGEDKEYTYLEYYNNSKIIARYILENFSDLGAPVLIRVSNSEYDLFIFMAILSLNLIYIPFSSDLSEEELRNLKKKSKASLIIDRNLVLEILNKSLKANIHETKLNFLKDFSQNTIIRESEHLSKNLEIKSKKKYLDLKNYENIHLGDDTKKNAFGIMSSGTTGDPKICIKSHKSIFDMCEIFKTEFSFSSYDIFANFVSFAYDSSLKAIYLSLYNRGTLLIIKPEYFTNPKKILDVLEKYSASVIFTSVFGLKILADFDALSYKKPSSINKIMFSGEKILSQTIKYWKENIPAKYYNLYAPTEYSFNLTYHLVSEEDFFDEISIGKTLGKATLTVVDEDLIELDAKEKGEFLISGEGLSGGYLGNVALTNEKFIDQSLIKFKTKTTKDKGKRYYCSGDYGYKDVDGNYYFLSRLDSQIKHLGYSVDLEYIDSFVNKIDGVKEAISVHDEKNDRILLFVNTDISLGDLRQMLSKNLPKYTLPNSIKKLDVNLSKIIRTRTGKLSRKLLKDILIFKSI